MGKTGHLTGTEMKEIIWDKNIDCFVETGTYKGDSTLEAAKLFDTVHTIEIMEDLYKASKERFGQSKSHITSYLGDSVKLLPEIAKSINSGCVWFLDAHQSGPDTGNNGVYVPLLKELEVILDNFDNAVDHIFIIDDLRFFSRSGNRPLDWSDISFASIGKCFVDRKVPVKSQSVMNDRYILFT